jgi:hypothetical protein
MVNFGRTKKMLGLENQDYLLKLQVAMDTRFEELYLKEVEKIRAQGEEEKRPTIVSSTTSNWCLPSFYLVFLKNAIEECKNRRMKLMSWPDFKKEIYLIYDHRVEHSPEINGAINNTFLTLDEHLLLYQCDQGGEKHSGREDNENRLMDFLYSLKYYCQRWPRAKMYARMLGFLHDEKVGVLAAKGSARNTRQTADLSLEENTTPTSQREKEELTQDSKGVSRPK